MNTQPIANQESAMNRRQFLQRAGQLSAAALATQFVPTTGYQAAPYRPSSSQAKPNLLVIMVDQMRSHQWFPDQATLDQKLPNIARIRNGAVSFTRHYTAANACTPSRSAMLTGLYTHQTYAMVTQVSDLDAGFPTWGDNLQQMGYHTAWFGKWHLAPTEESTPDLSVYGFDEWGYGGAGASDPHGNPAQGQTRDPDIASDFVTWVASASANNTPWCTTVSFINPHDIMWYPRFTEAIPQQSNPPKVFNNLAPNYETPAQLITRKKPKLQRALQTAAEQQFGIMRYAGPGFEAEWTEMLDLYLYLQQEVDKQVGRVLDALAANPTLAANTIILFTADHGEYCGSHGLRGKGGGAYEEAIRVPLYVKDPTGQWTQNPEIERTQLTSHIDLTPLLMTLANGSTSWKSDANYQHLANRFDMSTLLSNANAAGRPYVLHTTDENGLEEAPLTPFAEDPASHVICYRTATAKTATYSFWQEGSDEILTTGQEAECYDYATENGRLEIENVAGAGNATYTQMYNELTTTIIPNELRQPLPAALKAAQRRAYEKYLDYQHVYLPVIIEQ